MSTPEHNQIPAQTQPDTNKHITPAQTRTRQHTNKTYTPQPSTPIKHAGSVLEDESGI